MKIREQQNTYRPDMIQLLMEAKNGDLKFGKKLEIDTGFAAAEESSIKLIEQRNKRELNNIDITAQVILFFIAGYDTSATAMSNMLL